MLINLDAKSRFEKFSDMENLIFISDFFADFAHLEEVEKQTYYQMKVENEAKKYPNLSSLKIQALKNLILDSGISFSSFFFFFHLG